MYGLNKNYENISGCYGFCSQKAKSDMGSGFKLVCAFTIDGSHIIVYLSKWALRKRESRNWSRGEEL
jgi:hypothetical protein